MKSACSGDVQELSVDVKASTIIEGVGKKNFSLRFLRWHAQLQGKISFNPLVTRALTRILKIGVKTLPSRKSFTIHFYWPFSKSWSQIQKVGVKNSKFGW